MYVGGMGQWDDVAASGGLPGTSPSITDLATQAGQTLLQLYAQRQAAKTDIERARAGVPLAPTSYARPAPYALPRPGRIATGGGVSLPMIGVAAAVGLGVIFFLSRRR